jgi:hypothetical protein
MLTQTPRNAQYLTYDPACFLAEPIPLFTPPNLTSLVLALLAYSLRIILRSMSCRCWFRCAGLAARACSRITNSIACTLLVAVL